MTKVRPGVPSTFPPMGELNSILLGWDSSRPNAPPPPCTYPSCTYFTSEKTMAAARQLCLGLCSLQVLEVKIFHNQVSRQLR